MMYVYSKDGDHADGGLHTELPPELKDADKQTRIAAGWYDYVSTAPDTPIGKSLVCLSFVRSGDDFTGVYEIREMPKPQETIRYSVRKIICELKRVGKFAAVRQLLEAKKETLGYDWLFVGSNYLSSDDHDFAAICAAIVAAGIMTQTELDAMLPKCVWTVD